MARLTEVTFVSDGYTYKLALDFDDAALVQNTIAFDVSAERFGGEAGFHRITARVEIRPDENRLVVTLGDQVFETNVLDRGTTPAEEFIQRLPPELFGGDRIIGCAVKASLSAIIGQAIDCARRLEANLGLRIFGDYSRCMTDHFGQISKTAIFRAFQCILFY